MSKKMMEAAIIAIQLSLPPRRIYTDEYVFKDDMPIKDNRKIRCLLDNVFIISTLLGYFIVIILKKVNIKPLERDNKMG